jgi:heme/copper-type cytochrome/quinol oxidase subunit 3
MTTPTISVTHGHEDPETVGRRQRLGLLLLIAADVAFVFSMMFTWFYLRGLNTENAWIPAGGATVNNRPGWAMAAIVVVSWVAYFMGERGIRSGDRTRLVLGTLLALALLLVALGWQIYQAATLNVGPTDGAYASCVVLFIGSAIVHEILTIFFALAIWNRARLRLFSAESHWHVRLVGYWWLWIAVSAVLAAFTMSFTVSPGVGG